MPLAQLLRPLRPGTPAWLRAGLSITRRAFMSLREFRETAALQHKRVLAHRQLRSHSLQLECLSSSQGSSPVIPGTRPAALHVGCPWASLAGGSGGDLL